MRISLAILCAILTAQVSFGYVRRSVQGTTTPLFRTDTGGVQYYVNNQIKAGQTSSASGAQVTVVSSGSDPVSAIQAALASWNATPGSKLKFLPLKTTLSTHDSSDGVMAITFAGAEDTSLFQGAIALTLVQYSGGAGLLPTGATAAGPGQIYDADIILNPSLSFSTDGSTPYDLQGVVTHELGHALGLDHSAIFGATMFPFATFTGHAVLSQRFLSSDESAFASAVFASNPQAAGTLSGKTLLTNGNPVKGAVITVFDKSAGNMLSTMTGSDGTWSLALPAGSYLIYAEPFNGIVGAANFYTVDASQLTGGFQVTSLANEVVVPEGGKSAAPDLTVTATSTGLTLPFMSTGKAGGSGDIISNLFTPAPAVIASGQTFDIALLGGGVDATTVPQIIGGGMSIRANSIRVDSSVRFSDGPLLRATVDVESRSTPGLAILMITKGTSKIALSGLYTVVPPKPTFGSANVRNSADGNLPPGVSPGGLYTIYAASAANLGPATGLQPTAFDDYGKISGLLGGVSVTFDGQLAPMFYSAGGQLNVQVPFEVANRANTVVQVSYNGSPSDTATVPVIQSQPAFFGYGTDGTIVVNKDNSFNTVTNPVVRGDYVTFYGTGIGSARGYDVQTGRPAPGAPATYSGNSTCTLNGSQTIPVAYAGWTPTTVGLAQWTVIIGQDAPTGKVSVKCTDPYGAATPAGNLYIK